MNRLISIQAIVFSLVVIVTSNAFGALKSLYLDSTNPKVGDGSIENPYNTLASIRWSTIQGWVGAGDQVEINLKRGSLFKEILTVPISGADGFPIVLRDYGTGAKPAISGEVSYAPWSPFNSENGFIWQATAPAPVYYVWAGDTNLNKSANIALVDKSWFWDSGKLYLRSDAAEPDSVGNPVTAAVRANALMLTSVGWLSFSNVVFTKVTSYAVRLSGAHDVTFDDCEWRDCDAHLSLNDCSNLVFKTCLFQRSYGNQMALVQGAATSSSFYFCMFSGLTTAFNVVSSRALNFANCNFVSISGNSINNGSTGLVTVANCIFTGHAVATNTTGGAPIMGSGSKTLVHNSLVIPNGYDQRKHMLNVLETGRNYYQDPRYVSVNREAIVSFITDDYENYDDWIVYANLAKARGFNTTLALSKTDILTAQDESKIQAMVNRGHDVVVHTRSHPDLTSPFGFYLRYVGSGSSCVLSIQDGHLKTAVVGGQVSENLDLDLKQGNIDSTLELVNYLDKLASYTCRLYTIYNHQVPSILLQTIASQELATAEVPVPYNLQDFYTNEIWKSKQDVETAFKTPTGSNYVTHGLVYPGGYADDAVISQAIAAGFWGGRSTTPAPYTTHMEQLDLFQLPVPGFDTYGYVLMLRFERNGTDQSPSANNFTGVNTNFSTQAYRHSYAGDFNGTNSYFFRNANSDFNFEKGDWHFSAHIDPRVSTSGGTLFCCTNSKMSALKVTVNPDRSLSVGVNSNGFEIFSLSTPPAAISIGQYQKISVQQLFDRWFIRVNDDLVAATTNFVRFDSSVGQVFIGCGVSTVSGELNEFYNGLIDDAVVSNGTFYKTQAMLDMISQFGGILPQITHGESGAPREILRIFLDAVADYSGNVKVMTFDESLSYLRSKGTLGSDGRTLVRTDLGNHADYHLRGDSPCIRTGDSAILMGIKNLHDLDGRVVTDAQGGLQRSDGTTDIGAYLYSPPSAAPKLSIDRGDGFGAVRITLSGDDRAHYGLLASPDLFQWSELTNFIITGNSTTVTDPALGFSRFYKGVVREN